jgi:CheY-like chemotaxis protein
MIAVPRTSLLRVLIVDDCVDTTRTLSVLLQMWGHEAYTANDGLEALDAVRRYDPDVVLLDIGLPRLNGWELARRLRQQAGASELVLVALTGYGQEADRRRADEVGINHFFIKPVEPEVLRQILASTSALRSEVACTP